MGMAHADRLASRAKDAGVQPAAIWHSGKLRARQTAEAFLRHCNPMAEFTMVRGLLPDDPPQFARDLLAGEARDVMLVGHMPNIRNLLSLLLPGGQDFPQHGFVALETDDDGKTWREVSRAG